MNNNPSQAKNTDFLMTLEPLPLVSFWLQDFQLPSINVELMQLQHSTLDFPMTGEKANFDPITVSFLVDENWENWMEIYNLMFNAVHPNRPDLRTNLCFDSTITLLNGVKNPVARIKLIDCVPSILEGVPFDAGAQTAASLQSALTMEFSYMTVSPVGSG